MKYEFTDTKSFRKDRKKLSSKNRKLLDEVIDELLSGKPLAPKHKDHALSGNMKGLRDCHVLPDLVLIYEKREDILILKAIRVGSHSQVFS